MCHVIKYDGPEYNEGHFSAPKSWMHSLLLNQRRRLKSVALGETSVVFFSCLSKWQCSRRDVGTRIWAPLQRLDCPPSGFQRALEVVQSGKIEP